MSQYNKGFDEKLNKSKARYQQLKKVKDSHPEANFVHSQKAFHKLLNIQIASFVISKKKGRIIDLTKTNFAQLVLRNRSAIDFLKYSRRIADQDQFHAFMSNDEVEPEIAEQYNEAEDELRNLEAFDAETFQEKLKDVVDNPDKAIDEVVFPDD